MIRSAQNRPLAVTAGLAAVATAAALLVGAAVTVRAQGANTNQGTAATKKEALEASGVHVGETPSQTAQLARDVIAKLRQS